MSFSWKKIFFSIAFLFLLFYIGQIFPSAVIAVVFINVALGFLILRWVAAKLTKPVQSTETKEKKNTKLMIGAVLLIIGAIVEYLWRQDPRYADYDNYGPGFYLMAPGFYVLASMVKIGKKLGISFIALISLFFIFLCLYARFKQ